MSYDTHCSSCGMPYSDFAREGAKSCECHKMAAQAVRDFVFDKPALSASPVAQGNQLLTLLDDATVILQGLIEHPDDKDSWDDANKLLSKLLSRLERRGDECCAHGVELHQDCYRCDEGSPAPVAQEPVATAPVSPDVWTRRVVREAMQDAWNDICHDTGCHPIDIRNVNGVVFFEPRHWAEQVASLLFARTVRDNLASTPPATSAGVGADEIAPLLEEARDMLLERIYGNPARSPGHNARLKIEKALALLSRAGDQK